MEPWKPRRAGPKALPSWPPRDSESSLLWFNKLRLLRKRPRRATGLAAQRKRLSKVSVSEQRGGNERGPTRSPRLGRPYAPCIHRLVAGWSAPVRGLKLHRLKSRRLSTAHYCDNHGEAFQKYVISSSFQPLNLSQYFAAGTAASLRRRVTLASGPTANGFSDSTLSTVYASYPPSGLGITCP